ncbi:MAG TPA: aminotransferase class V-fold PLP-dependent enzyme [Pirellulales bacterium]
MNDEWKTNSPLDPTLAIHGGRPACPDGPPRWPPHDEAVAAALGAAAEDGSWGHYNGPHLPRLAAALAERFAVQFVLPCCSGTFAVQLALRALGVGSGDEVILAGYDFPGNFRAIEAVGATPVLVDIAADSWNLDVRQLASVTGDKIKAVLASHLHGGLVDMQQLMALARERGWLVVEDACQVPGAGVCGRPAGSWGDAGVLSFGGSKLLSAGRGGAVLCHQAEVQQRAKIFCEQGNHAFPLSELQALVVHPQLESLPSRHGRRLQAVARLLAGLQDTPGLRPLTGLPDDSSPAYYKLAFEYRGAALGNCPREQFVRMVQAEGIALDTGFRGFLQRGPRRCRRGMSLHVAGQAAERAVLLHHPALLEEPTRLDHIAAGLKKVCTALAR